MYMKSTNINLPVIQETEQADIKELVFPTGKPHISYSELFDWIECSWRHKLKHIDKLNFDGPTVHTEFGQVIHDAMEDYLNLSVESRSPINPGPYQQAFMLKYDALPRLEDQAEQKKLDDMSVEFHNAMPKLLFDAPKWLDETFPGWVTVATEDLLYEKIPGQEDVSFKGFVDAFIKVPKRRKKRKPKVASAKAKGLRLSDIVQEEESAEYEEVPGQWEYYVLDWKTSGWGWTADKKRDFNKQLQIMLYKIFYCQKMNLNYKDIKCGFVLLKRKPTKTGSHCELVPVSVGPKSFEKALATVNSMVNQVKKGRVVKNRWSCKYCRFANTEHCM